MEMATARSHRRSVTDDENVETLGDDMDSRGRVAAHGRLVLGVVLAAAAARGHRVHRHRLLDPLVASLSPRRATR